jgi:transcriptional regulator with XRE-family HTH domain
LKTKVGSWIRTYRKKKRLSQKKLAEKLGVTQPLVCWWEQGTARPSNEMLEKLSAILEADLEEELRSDLGDWLLKKREELKLTREQLAKKAGISPLTIYFIENGTTKSPQDSTLKGLEKALGQLPASLREGVEETRGVGDFEFLGPFPIDQWAENIGEGKIPCIYVFYDSLNRPVRIGETEDLKRRMKDYALMYWFRSPTAETFAYVIVKDAKFRSQAEKVMIKLAGAHAIFNIQEKI